MKKIRCFYCFVLMFFLLGRIISYDAKATQVTDPESIIFVQQYLTDHGYDCGTPDGIYGNITAGAIKQFQKDNGIEQDGLVTEDLLSIIKNEEIESASEPEEDINDVSEKYKDNPVYVAARIAEVQGYYKVAENLYQEAGDYNDAQKRYNNMHDILAQYDGIYSGESSEIPGLRLTLTVYDGIVLTEFTDIPSKISHCIIKYELYHFGSSSIAFAPPITDAFKSDTEFSYGIDGFFFTSSGNQYIVYPIKDDFSKIWCGIFEKTSDKSYYHYKESITAIEDFYTSSGAVQKMGKAQYVKKRQDVMFFIHEDTCLSEDRSDWINDLYSRNFTATESDTSSAVDLYERYLGLYNKVKKYYDSECYIELRNYIDIYRYSIILGGYFQKFPTIDSVIRFYKRPTTEEASTFKFVTDAIIDVLNYAIDYDWMLERKYGVVERITPTPTPSPTPTPTPTNTPTPTPKPTSKPSYSSNYSSSSTSSYSSSFTNKYGTPTTKCAHPGCSNYIASSGDTNCCVIHSNRCLDCGKYIDEDAMYCMSCLGDAFYDTYSGGNSSSSYSSSGSGYSSSYSSGVAGGPGKCKYKVGGTYVCNKSATVGNFCSEHAAYLDDIYNSLF